MTVVCALRDGNVILMSADTAATSDNGFRVSRRDKKLFRLAVPEKRHGAKFQRGMLLGFCGEYNRFQLMACAFKPPTIHAEQDAWAYMVSAFVPALREFMLLHFGEPNEPGLILGSESETLLIAFKKRIFSVFSNGQVEETRDGFSAIGAQEAALGAMHALKCSSEPSWEVLESAMRAAEAYNSSVRAPFDIEVLFDHL